LNTPSVDVDSIMSATPAATALRALVGIASGWAIVEVAAPASVPGWWAVVASATLAVALVVVPGTNRWAGRGLNSGWALATLCGLYVGVPETDHIVGMAPVLGIVWLGELTGRMRVDALVVAALDIVLVWAAVEGAVNRSGAMIAGVSLLGLLVVAPIVIIIAGTESEEPMPAWAVGALIALQLLFAVSVARVGGVRTTAAEATTVVIVALPVLGLLAAPILARRTVT
jgi:hypothetical protein